MFHGVSIVTAMARTPWGVYPMVNWPEWSEVGRASEPAAHNGTPTATSVVRLGSPR